MFPHQNCSEKRLAFKNKNFGPTGLAIPLKRGRTVGAAKLLTGSEFTYAKSHNRCDRLIY